MIHKLVGRFNPSEKYARRIGSSPQGDAMIKKHLPEITTYQRVELSHISLGVFALESHARHATHPTAMFVFCRTKVSYLSEKKNSFHVAGLFNLKMWDEWNPFIKPCSLWCSSHLNRGTVSPQHRRHWLPFSLKVLVLDWSDRSCVGNVYSLHESFVELTGRLSRKLLVAFPWRFGITPGVFLTEGTPKKTRALSMG